MFRRPLTVKDACARVADWMEFPNVVWLDSESGDVPLAARLLESAGAGANLVTDAQVAAIALRLGASVCSCGHDFGRFHGVDWTDPLA